MKYSRLFLLFISLSLFNVFLNGIPAAGLRSVNQIISYINETDNITVLELLGIDNLKLPVRVIDLIKSIISY